MVSTTEVSEDITPMEIEEYIPKSQKYFGVIYCYTSKINQKMYIGQTISPHARHISHISSSKIDSKRKDSHLPFHNAIRKYGIENFKYRVLRICTSSNLDDLKDEMDKHERELISYYETTEPDKGYNLLSGGVSSPKGHTSYWAQGVKQYSIFGELIQEFDCINEAYRQTRIHPSCISSACSNNSKRKMAGGYLWRYKNDKLNVELIQHATRGVVHRYTIEGEYIDTFNSLKDASKYVKGDSTRIMLCAKPPYNHVAYGFRWSRKKMNKLTTKPVKLNIEVHQYDMKGYYLASYSSQMQAAKSVGLKSGTHLLFCLREPWRKCGGYYWRTYKCDKIEIPKHNRKTHGKQEINCPQEP